MKNIVITGSTRGIGLCMAREFLQSGCNVTLSGRGERLSESVRADLSAFEKQIIYVPCNVQSMSDVQNLWDRSKEKWGRIDIWINNAGQNAPHEYIYNTAECYVDSTLATNLRGMIYGCQVASVGMIAQKGGAIYSMEGLGSNNMVQPKTILYGTTKHALTYFMKGLAKELQGTGVIAGRLSPGMMLTDFITKSPDTSVPVIQSQESFRKIFNMLADKPETVAKFFVPKMLANTRNNVQFEWLTTAKAAARFMSGPFTKRKILEK
jgi:NAD(P)-dependent dehydrogenase (short-subunit alcohol dehydrogenase family)